MWHINKKKRKNKVARKRNETRWLHDKKAHTVSCTENNAINVEPSRTGKRPESLPRRESLWNLSWKITHSWAQGLLTAGQTIARWWRKSKGEVERDPSSTYDRWDATSPTLLFTYLLHLFHSLPLFLHLLT